MFLHSVLFAVFLLGFLRDINVSCCDYNCPDKPVFTPSRLVVKYDDNTSASCAVCQSGCQVFGLEHNVGVKVPNGTTITWKVDRMTQWETSPQCYYENDNGDQCCSRLPVTVYKTPDFVSLSFVGHTGPMVEGHQYTLRCQVINVAPVENLAVTFYRGQTRLGQPQSIENPEKTPVTEIYTLNIITSKEDDGANYWCEAKLELGPYGPQPPPAVKSEHINTTVHYKPRFSSTPSLHLNLTEGDPLELHCLAIGNPSPTYNWTSSVAHQSLLNSSSYLLNISSVTPADAGQYKCSASNNLGTVTRTFDVVVVRGVEVIPTRLASKNTTTTTTKTTTTTTVPSRGASSTLVHSFIMCFMLLVSGLI